MKELSINNDIIVGLVVNSFDAGGLEQVVYNLYNGYRSKGIKTYILSSKSSEDDKFVNKIDIDNFYVYDNNPNLFWGFCYKKHITHLHYHYNVFEIEKAHYYGVKTIYTLHNTYTWFNDDEINYRAKVLMYANKVVAVSNYVKKYFISRTNFPEYQIQTILNGVDTKELANNNDDFEYTRKYFGFNNEDIVFSEIATFDRRKNQIGLLDVAKKVISIDSRIKFIFVGNIGDKQYFKEFKNVASKMNKNIKILNYIPHEQIGQFLRETSDVVIQTSYQEGCSNSVLEAICCGNPLIISDVGNARDIENKSAIKIVERIDGTINEATINAQEELAINDEIVNCILDLSSNIKTYKKNAAIYMKNSKEFDKNEMVNQYIKLIETL